MTAPTQDAPAHPAAAKDFDEIAAELKAQAGSGTDLGEIKLDGDGVPESLRGKTAADAVKQAAGLGAALKVSEDARTAMAADAAKSAAELAALRAVGGTATAAPPAEEDAPSMEDIAKVYEEDPLKAMGMMSDVAAKRLEANLEQRLGPLSASNAESAEANARQRYPDEFMLFTEDIDSILSQRGLSRASLTTSAHWDDLIKYVRGSNVDRLIEHKGKVAGEKASAEARAAAGAEVGFSGTAAAARTPAPAAGGQLDETQKEIIRVMQQSGVDIDEKSYYQWAKVG